MQHGLHQTRDPVPELGGIGVGVVFAEDGGADLGVAHAGHALGQGKVGDGPVAGSTGEGMVGLQPDEHAEGASGDLGSDVGAVLGGCDRFGHELLPQVGRSFDLQHREGHRDAGLGGQSGHPLDLFGRVDDVFAGRTDGRELEHAAAAVGEGSPETEQLVLGSEGSRHGLAVDGAVRDGARRRHTECAGRDGLAHDGGHGLDVVGGGRFVLGAPLAHHVATHGAVGDLGGDVHGVAATRQVIEVLGEGLPLPVDALGERSARDVLDALHQLDQPVLRAGAHGREADAAVAHDQGGDAVHRAGRQLFVPGGLAVVVGVHVDETRRHEQTGGVDDLARHRRRDRHRSPRSRRR